mgnify:CR=1 FL=1
MGCGVGQNDQWSAVLIARGRVYEAPDLDSFGTTGKSEVEVSVLPAQRDVIVQVAVVRWVEPWILPA